MDPGGRRAIHSLDCTFGQTVIALLATKDLSTRTGAGSLSTVLWNLPFLRFGIEERNQLCVACTGRECSWPLMSQISRCELHDYRRILIVAAISDPSWPDADVNQIGPTCPRRTVRPR